MGSLSHISDLEACRGLLLILCAFIIGNSRLEPLLEGLLAQIHMDLSSWGFSRNRIGDLQIIIPPRLSKGGQGEEVVGDSQSWVRAPLAHEETPVQ